MCTLHRSRTLPLAWLEIEEIDRVDQGEDLLLDGMKVWGASSEEEAQELIEFHRLPHRNILALNLILQWIEQNISSEITSRILQNWDDYQIDQVPEESRYRALKIRTWFDKSNWQSEENTRGNRYFRFVGVAPSVPEIDAKAEADLRQIQPFEIIMICRRILNGELEKTLELHQELVSFLTNEEKFKSLEERFEDQAFVNVVWAMITIILNSPFYTLTEEVEIQLQSIAEGLAAFPIHLDCFSRRQVYDLNAEAFIAHVAPKLLRLNQAESAFRVAAFRCFVGARNGSTCTFMGSWIKEYGLENPLTRQLINVAPRIARLVLLTRAFAYIKHIQKVSRPDGSYIFPRPEEIDHEIGKREDPQIEEAWLSLQHDFVESKLQVATIINTCEWTPEVLSQPVQQLPNWMRLRFIRPSFDWEFLTAALIPILEVKIENDETQKFISSLCEQVLFALLSERKSTSIVLQEEQRYERTNTQLSESQIYLLYVICKCSYMDVTVRLAQFLNILKSLEFVDCVVLELISDPLSNCFDQSTTSENVRESSKDQVIFAIGDYLFKFKNESDCKIQIFGKPSKVWEKLIDLLSRESRIPENVARADQSLVQFFKRFHEVILSHWWLRRKLYRVAKLVEYKQFRRIIFQSIVEYPDLLPDDRNDESESLVQVLAKLWDSDRRWITARQSRCQDLRTLLGQLQEIDAEGARILADQVASVLANPSS